jgi:rubredoxin
MGGDSAATDDRRPCPMCGEFIPPQALKCRFCGEIFDPELKKAQKPESGPNDDLTSGEWIFGILCSGIACITGIVWLVQGKKKGGKLILVSLVSSFILNFIQALAKGAAN